MIKALLIAALILSASQQAKAAVSVVASNAAGAAQRNPQTDGISVTHGFTLSNGDVLYACVVISDDAGTGGSSTSGGTWTEIAFLSTALGADRLISVLRRVVIDAGSEPAAYTFFVDENTALVTGAVVAQLRGVNITTPEDGTITELAGDNDFTPDQPAATTTTDNAAMLLCYGASSSPSTAFAGADEKTSGAPSGFAIVDDLTVTDAPNKNNPIYIAMAIDLDVGTAGAIDPGVWTGTPDDAVSDYVLISIPIKPAAAASSIFIIPYPQFID